MGRPALAKGRQDGASGRCPNRPGHTAGPRPRRRSVRRRNPFEAQRLAVVQLAHLLQASGGEPGDEQPACLGPSRHSRSASTHSHAGPGITAPLRAFTRSWVAKHTLFYRVVHGGMRQLVQPPVSPQRFLKRVTKRPRRPARRTGGVSRRAAGAKMQALARPRSSPARARDSRGCSAGGSRRTGVEAVAGAQPVLAARQKRPPPCQQSPLA